MMGMLLFVMAIKTPYPVINTILTGDGMAAMMDGSRLMIYHLAVTI